MFEFSFESHSAETTRKIGFVIGAQLRSNDIVALIGEMGAGKTTLVQGIALGLGVSPETHVTSPSFVLVNRYSGIRALYHVDLYRLDGDADFNDLELDEIMHDDGVVVIEWPQVILPRLPKIDLIIRLIWDMSEIDARRIILEAPEELRFEKMIETLKSCAF
jgi:tRNA threonylcarbamoyladenosine biosynthesis protein TsaE